MAPFQGNHDASCGPSITGTVTAPRGTVALVGTNAVAADEALADQPAAVIDAPVFDSAGMWFWLIPLLVILAVAGIYLYNRYQHGRGDRAPAFSGGRSYVE